MRKSKLTLVLALALLCIVTMFCGCGNNGEIDAIMEAPKEIFERYSPDGNDTKYDTARLFIDNTYSVYGYILSGTGMESGYCNVVSRIMDFMNKFDKEEYYCLEDTNNRTNTEWVRCDKDDFKYRAKDFYKVYGKLSNPYELDDLQENDKGFNIYVTDLAEGTDVNKSLAEKINNNITSGKNRGTLLYCFLVRYSGVNYVDENNVVKDETGDFTQWGEKIYLNRKPIYVIISGETEEINDFCDEFNKNINERGFKAGTDYFYEKFIPGKGLEKGEPVFRTEEFYSSTYEKDGKDPLSKYYSFDNTELNYSVEEMYSNVLFDNLYEDLPGLFLKVQESPNKNDSGENKYKGRFSFIVDLPTTKIDGVTYSVEIDDIYFANDSTIEQLEEEVTDENGETTSVTTYKQSFSLMDTDDYFTLIDNDNNLRLMTSESKKIDADYTILRINDAKLAADKGENQEIKLEPKKESGESYLITLSFTGGKSLEEKYNALIICYSVKGSVPVKKEIPEWIKKYDADSARYNGNSDKNTQAEGLKYIYEYLNGTMNSETLRQKYEECMAADVCKFPVVIDFRDYYRN